MQSHSIHRRTTLTLGFIVLVLNALGAVLFSRLPDDPLSLAYHLSIYSWFASILGLIGIIGASKNNGTLVSIFANYLFIDILLCTIPRVLAVSLFPEIRDALCSAESIQTLLAPAANQYVNFLKSQSPALDTTAGLEIGITDVSATNLRMQDRCRNIVFVLQVIVACAALAVTAMQTLLALRVSSYASMLAQQEDAHYMAAPGQAQSGERYADEEKSLERLKLLDDVVVIEERTGDVDKLRVELE